MTTARPLATIAPPESGRSTESIGTAERSVNTGGRRCACRFFAQTASLFLFARSERTLLELRVAYITLHYVCASECEP